ncbi:MAG: sigma-54-dependent Fis family transcriptional regulator [Acidobacteriia bacterium]|nr:sigma-54-dependent Fis family transcriptional regulator [Terriglobia bacterium]
MTTLVEEPVAIKTKGRILIVDDEFQVRDSLGKSFTREGYMAHTSAGGRDALDAVRDQEFDIALLDIHLDGTDAAELAGLLREADPDLMIIMMAGYDSVESAAAAFRRGAYGYLTKPIVADELFHLVENALEQKRTRAELARLRQELAAATPIEWIGVNAASQKITERIATAASSQAAVLITGESGTGKEMVARAIHAAGPCGPMPMLTIRCGALSEALLERELFGHRTDEFTGASRRKNGKLEMADGGTVFLDEIGSLSRKSQLDLLRVLERREIAAAGGEEPIPVDFRCIAASTQSLKTLVDAGEFLPDLFERLNEFPIELPPLRDRREDIPFLANHFLNQFSRETSRRAPQLSTEALDGLVRYDWPGNVRELKNAIERALILTPDSEIRASDFAFHTRRDEWKGGRTLEDVERLHIERILRETQNNMSRTARILDIDRTTLYNKVRRYRMR